MATQSDSLSDELAFFNERKSELLERNEGQFALIKGRELLGTFTTFDEAYAAGIAKLGNVPMLIRRIVREEPVEQAPALAHGLLRIHA